MRGSSAAMRSPTCLRETQQIGDVGSVLNGRGERAQSHNGAFCPALIAGDNDYPGTLRCEPLSCHPPDSRCRSSNDDDFPEHRYPPGG